MNKFIKYFTLTAVVILLIGGILSIIGFTAGGVEADRKSVV